ncbi:hypothetical protein ACLOJK_003109 [Asimina triloba]
MNSQPQINSTASAWILEFLFRQPNLDPRVPRRLLSVLPVAHRHTRLLKTLLLRSISDDLSAGSLSESALDCLESIEELDHAAGIRIPASMPAAYASVAVACTARLLKDEPPQEQDGFVDAVNRIWKGRVSDMETSNCRVGLVSEELAEAKKAVLMAIWKKTKRDQFQRRDTMKEALDLVRIFLEQAWEGMGSSFLERAAAEVFKMKSGQQDSLAGLGPNDGEVAVVEDASKGKGIDQCKAADEAAVTMGPSTEGGQIALKTQDNAQLFLQI